MTDDYVELTGNDLPYHLRPDSAGARCSACGRTSWAEDEFYGVCGMPQPNGEACAGIIGRPA